MGIDDLLQAVAKSLFETFIDEKVKLPYSEGGLISLFHEQGQVEKEEHIQGGIIIEGRVPGRLAARFTPFKWIGDNEAGFVNGYRGLIDAADEEGDDYDDSEI
jgi:GTP-binding protein HflX